MKPFISYSFFVLFCLLFTSTSDVCLSLLFVPVDKETGKPKVPKGDGSVSNGRGTPSGNDL